MKIGPYEVRRKLGEGAYGKVYLARKADGSGFATWYALKRIARGNGRGPEFEEYLRREARLGGLVNHPHLVRVHEVLTLKSEWVLVQDYVDGVTLRSVLQACREEGRPVPREAALELGAELLDALHYLHTLRDPEGRESGFIHRDVKPGNVMLTEGHGLRVMDFGVARGEEAGAGTLAGELRGTLAYMAPEQATGGHVGPASDQFAAGLILLELLINAPAWGDLRGSAVLGRVVTGDVSAGLGCLEDDDPVMPLLLRLLAREPSARFPTASDAARALRLLRAQTPTPPALRDFCVSEVLSLRAGAKEEEDDSPSWTGSFHWSSKGGTGSSGRGPSLGPPPDDAAPEPDPRSPTFAPSFDDEDADPDALELPFPSAARGAEERDPSHEELELDEDRSGGVASAGMGMLQAVAEFDVHQTLPATTGQRVALFRSLGLDAQDGVPGDGGVPPGGLGTGDELAALRERIGELDVMETLPLQTDRAALRPTVGAGRPPPAPTPGLPPAPVPSSPSVPRQGEPAQAGAAGVPQIPVQPLESRRRRGPLPGPLPAVSIGTSLLAQFMRSPLLNAGVLLGLLLLIAATARIAWIAFVEPAEHAAADPGLDEDDLRLPSQRAGVAPRPLLSAPAPEVAPPPPTDAELLARVAEPEPGTAVVGDPGSVQVPAGVPGTATALSPSDRGTAAAPVSSISPRSVVSTGGGLDADLEAWRGTSSPAPTPERRAPRPGEIVGGTQAGERMLESGKEPTRRVATRRGEDGEDAAAEPTPAPPPAAAQRLRFISSMTQPASVPLSVRVRAEGFFASEVVVYYQWRSVGSAGRKRRSLRAENDGSFALEIPVSELQVDRLQLWFVAEPGAVALAGSSAPLEVRVQ